MAHDPSSARSTRAPHPNALVPLAAPGAIIGNAELPVPERGNVASQIRALVAVAVQEVEDVAVDEAEVARVMGQLVAAQPVNQPIKQRLAPAGGPAHRGATHADTIRYPAPMLHEFDNELGRVWRSQIDLHGRLAAREAIAGQDRALEGRNFGSTGRPEPAGIAGSEGFEALDVRSVLQLSVNTNSQR